MLSIHQYRKRYHDHEILSIAQLELPQGIYWIKGENGSGKSTLFKSIAGLIPFEGDIRCHSLSVNDHPVQYRRRIQYAEAEPLFPGFLTGKDLVRFTGKTRNASVKEQDECASRFGITSFFEQPCETFSSGMTKKLSLTLAFLGAPDIIILDEPLITLDVQARQILLDEIVKRAAKGTTFLLSSHQLLESTDFPLTGSFHIREKQLFSDDHLPRT
jgi:ABC-2 type transport system ATP-binding protein